MDNDFPTLAGSKLGLGPMNIKEGLSNGSLTGLRLSNAVGQLWPRNPMAPENSEPHYTASGGYQPEEAYGA